MLSVLIDLGARADVEPDTQSPVVWRGPRLTFTKPAFADPTTPEAQDRINDRIILTRGSGDGLYNIAQEDSVTRSVSPAGTLWALGTTDEIDSLEFLSLKEAANGRMQDLPNQDIVLFLIEENIYIDVRFLSWRNGRTNGGGFSYERTTPNE